MRTALSHRARLIRRDPDVADQLVKWALNDQYSQKVNVCNMSGHVSFMSIFVDIYVIKKPTTKFSQTSVGYASFRSRNTMKVVA